jgi:multimeric flavodoxin WrbA
MQPVIRALGIAASPRRNGNSTSLLRAALQGAADAGAESAVIRLNDLTFKGCQACVSCPQTSCRQHDAMTPVLAALQMADLWLFASPIYFDGVAGQFKTFFDRLYWFRRQETTVKPRLQGRRRAALLMTYEDAESAAYRAMAHQIVQYVPSFGDFAPPEILSCSGLGPADAAAAKPELLDQARALGRRLVGELAPPAPP